MVTSFFLLNFTGINSEKCEERFIEDDTVPKILTTQIIENGTFGGF